MKKFKQRNLSSEQRKQLSEFKRNQRKNIGKVIDRKQKEMVGSSVKFWAAVILVVFFFKFLMTVLGDNILDDGIEEDLPQFLIGFIFLYMALVLHSRKERQQHWLLAIFVLIVSIALFWIGYYFPGALLLFIVFKLIRVTKNEEKMIEEFGV